jgi:hypothetical protein
MEARGQLHVPAALSSGKVSPGSTGQESGLAPEPFCTLNVVRQAEAVSWEDENSVPSGLVGSYGSEEKNQKCVAWVTWECPIRWKPKLVSQCNLHQPAVSSAAFPIGCCGREWTKFTGHTAFLAEPMPALLSESSAKITGKPVGIPPSVGASMSHKPLSLHCLL